MECYVIATQNEYESFAQKIIVCLIGPPSGAKQIFFTQSGSRVMGKSLLYENTINVGKGKFCLNV